MISKNNRPKMTCSLVVNDEKGRRNAITPVIARIAVIPAIDRVTKLLILMSLGGQNLPGVQSVNTTQVIAVVHENCLAKIVNISTIIKSSC